MEGWREGGRKSATLASQWLAAASPACDEALGFLRFWLGSIVVHARSRCDASLPPIALVGTHKDKVYPHSCARVGLGYHSGFST
jgi:hypothetical protein